MAVPYSCTCHCGRTLYSAAPFERSPCPSCGDLVTSTPVGFDVDHDTGDGRWPVTVGPAEPEFDARHHARG